MKKTSANAPRIGRFLLSHRLGRDSIATVYRATDPRHRRDVAIKLLHAQTNFDNALQQIREQMMDQVRHPALCSLYSIDQHQGLSFLAYEYVEGVDLADILAADGVRARDVMPMLRALIAGFAQLHLKGICHLGLTPNRIKVSADGLPKILSLGRSLLLEASAESNIVKRVELRYMAPEQFDQKAGDSRTDVFRLCLVLFELIARKPAIKAGAVLDIRDQVKNLDPAPDAFGKSPSALAMMSFLRKGLAADPEHRYADASEMLAALPKLARTTPTPGQRTAAAESAVADSVPHPIQPAGPAEPPRSCAVANEGAPQGAVHEGAVIDDQAPGASTTLGDQHGRAAPADERRAEAAAQTAAQAAFVATAAPPDEAQVDDGHGHGNGNGNGNGNGKDTPSTQIKQLVKPTPGDGEQTLAYVLDKLAKSDDFPALSQSVFEVNQLTSLQANATVSQIAEVILRDYALSNKLLTLANSAYYGVRVEVTRVTDAIRLLGFEQVRITANGLAYTAQVGPGREQLRDAMLKSFTSGLVARQLAEDMQIKDAEEAFLCAMFYDTGEHLIIHYLPDEYAHTISRRERALANSKDEAAAQVLGITFAKLGAAVARSWRFPETIVNAIEGLNAAGEPLDDAQLIQLSWLTRGANELCELAGRCAPDNADDALQSLVLRLAEHLRIDDKDLRKALHDAAQKAQAFAPVLGVDANSSAYMQALLLWGPAPVIDTTTQDVPETETETGTETGTRIAS